MNNHKSVYFIWHQGLDTGGRTFLSDIAGNLISHWECRLPSVDGHRSARIKEIFGRKKKRFQIFDVEKFCWWQEAVLWCIFTNFANSTLQNLHFFTIFGRKYKINSLSLQRFLKKNNLSLYKLVFQSFRKLFESGFIAIYWGNLFILNI